MKPWQGFENPREGFRTLCAVKRTNRKLSKLFHHQRCELAAGAFDETLQKSQVPGMFRSVINSQNLERFQTTDETCIVPGATSPSEGLSVAVQQQVDVAKVPAPSDCANQIRVGARMDDVRIN